MFTSPRQARPARANPARFAPIPRIASAPATALLAATLLSATLLSGCSTASYPSLALRPGETQAKPADISASAPAITPAPAELIRQLDGWVADARAANVRFTAARPHAEAALAAARGAARGTEVWSTASIALAELERARSDAGVAQASVEFVYADDRLTHATQEGPTPRPSAKLIAAARNSITAITEAQDKTLATLRKRLPD